MDDIEKNQLIEVFAYLASVHRQQEDVLQKISDIYSETLYTDSIPKVREAVEIYLNCLTDLRRANLNLMGTYVDIVGNLSE